MQSRITLIHATPVSIDPVLDSFAAIWPEATIGNLLDDSLAPDLADAGELTREITARIGFLARYAADAGADGILFTCSAFGEAIEAAAAALPVPVLRPNEAMFRSAVKQGKDVAMIATFPPSVAGMEAEFRDEAERAGTGARLKSFVVPEAIAALRAGDRATHDRLVAECAAGLTDCDVIMLAHFSTSRALEAVSAATDIPVLTAPGAAVAMLKQALNGKE